MLFLASACLACCTSKEKKAKYAHMEQASWLKGTWENTMPEGRLSEKWEKINDSLYKGQSFFIKDKDTLHYETINFYQKNGKLIYEPTVKGQNNDASVSFKLTKITDSLLVFENPAHDYPQKIVYRRITDDSLAAEISGKQQGKPASEMYPMKKK
jgi:hypothetical protein